MANERPLERALGGKGQGPAAARRRVALGETLAVLLLGVVLGAAGVAVLAPLLRQGTAGRGPATRRAALASDAQDPADRLTSAWSLAELGSPLVLARDLPDGLAVPAGSRAVVSGRAGLAVLRSSQVRRGAEVPVEAAVGGDGRRALLFPVGVRPGTLALSVTDGALVARLASLAEAAWGAAGPYRERRALADLGGEPGVPVEAEGRVAQSLPRPSPGLPGGVLLRLEDGAHSAAVHAARDDGLVGRRVRVQGRTARDASGYPVVEAETVVPTD